MFELIFVFIFAFVAGAAAGTLYTEQKLDELRYGPDRSKR